MRAALSLLAVALWASTAAAQRSEAVRLKQKGDELATSDRNAAAAAYRKAIARDPNYMPAYEALSLHQLRQRRFAAAVKLLRSAVQRNPRFAEGWYNLAYALRKQGKLDEALIAYQRNAALAPSSADPHYGIGLVLKAQGRSAAAAASFRRYVALEKRPNRSGWVKKAEKLAAALTAGEGKPAERSGADEIAKTGKDRAAKRERERAAAAAEARPRAAHPRVRPAPGARAAEPEKPTPGPSAVKLTPARKKAMRLRQQGDGLLKAGRIAEAVAYFRQAVAVDFSYVAAYNELGNALFRLGRHDEAIRVFRTAIRDNPEYHLGWYNLAYALRKANRLPEAVAAYRKYNALRPADPDPLFGLGLSYRSMGRKKEAVAAFKRYIAAEQRPAQQKWVARARKHVAEMEGAPAPAPTPAAATAAKPEKRSPAEQKRKKAEERKRAREEARQRKLEERQRKLEERRRLAEERKRAREEARQRKLEERQRKLEEQKRAAKGARGDAGRPGAVATTPVPAAATRVSAGAATSAAAQALATDRPSPIPPPARPGARPSSAAGKLCAQGDTLALNKKCREALGFYRQAITADPFAVRAYDGIAYCAHRMGDYVAGTRALSIALRDNPGYHRGWLHLARLHRLSGRNDLAVGAYRNLIRYRPTDPTAHLELARALKGARINAEAAVAYRHYLRLEGRQGTEAQRTAARAELAAVTGVASPASAGAAATPKAGEKLADEILAAGAASAEIGKVRDLKVPGAEGPAAAQEASAPTEKLSPAEARRRARAEKRRKAQEARKARLAALRAAREERRRKRDEARQARLEARQAARERKISEARQRQLDLEEDRRIAELQKSDKAGERLAAAVARSLPPTGERPVRDVLRPAPEVARQLVEIADQQFAKRRYVVALGLYRQAAALDARATEPVYKAGVCAVALGQMHLAAELFEQVLQQDPHNGTAAVNLKLAQAAAAATKPTPEEAQRQLARARRELREGHFALAERHLETIVEATAAAEAFALRSEARLAQGKGEQALSDAGRALALDPAARRPVLLMAEAHQRLGQRAKARYYYRLFLVRATNEDERSEARRKLLQLEGDTAE